MAVEWSADRVLAMAPDPASARAGQGLGSAKKWASLGRGEGLLWGECQGSGKDPYQTKVLLDEAASSCSCPSRKFPCKHGLGLMLVWASSPKAIAEKPLPAWVASWKESREKKADAKKEKVDRGPAPVDPAAKAKREAARMAKVSSGLDDLALWMGDLVRQGFASLANRPGNVWADQARRMIDAQAPGVARRLRQIDEMGLAGDGWPPPLLDRLGRLHLLREGFSRIEALPEGVAEDVRAAIGFPVDQDVLRAGPTVSDHWQVIGQGFGVEDRVTACRTWLLGRDSGRPAMLLDFGAGGKSPEPALRPGCSVHAEIAFFPGSAPLRTVLVRRLAEPEDLAEIRGATTIDRAYADLGDRLAKNPWTELTPVAIVDVILQEKDGDWWARDASGAAIPLTKTFALGWDLLALGGGRPVTLSGEFDGSSLNALGCLIGGRFHVLGSARDSAPGDWPGAASVPAPLLVESSTSALVGVDRRPPPDPSGSPAIGRALSGLERAEAPSRLLSIAAASALHARAGRRPTADPSPLPPECPPESRPECDPSGAKRLLEMLPGERGSDVAEWLGLLSASGRVLPPESLVDLFDRADLIDIPANVLGERGRWLALRNPKWRKFAGADEAADPAVTWETGTHHERVATLHALRLSDPGRARELVLSTFASEPADKRAEFVAGFATGLSMADEPLLEAALDDRGKDVRRWAGEHLRHLPGSRLVARMVERARPLLTWAGAKVSVKLPSACDKAMIRDGVDPKPPSDLKLGERAWWLRQVVAAVPPGTWEEASGLRPEALVASLKGEWAADLWTAWGEAASRSRDVAWLEALLARRSKDKASVFDPAGDIGLFRALPPDRRDAFLAAKLASAPASLREGHPAIPYLTRIAADGLGREAGLALIRWFRELLQDERGRYPSAESLEPLPEYEGSRYDHKYHHYQLFYVIDAAGMVLPPDLADEAAAGFDLADGPRPKYAVCFAQMIDHLRSRRDMHREFAP